MKIKRIAIIANYDVGLYKFRRELVEALIKENNEICLLVPNGKYIKVFKNMGCQFYETPIERHGTNPVTDWKLIKRYKRFLREIKPGVVLTFTIKPNIYGGIVCARLGIPYIANITGLGTAVENGGLMQKFTVMLYKLAFRKIQCVFFQNEENRQFFIDKRIALGKHQLLPGSGVNLEHFQVLPYPDDKKIHFAFISRIMKEKGINQYLEAAQVIKKEYPNTFFHVCGFCEEEYEQKLADLEKQGIIIYHGMVDDIREILKITHCTIHPSYYPEGMSNVLLESAACGRPIITTDRSGCREVVEDGVTGYRVPCEDTKALINAIQKFLEKTQEERYQMGLAGRDKVNAEFDRNKIVNSYLREIVNLKISNIKKTHI